MLKHVNTKNCVSVVETFCDRYPEHIPLRADSYKAAQLMVRYLTKSQYIEDFCDGELMDTAYICLVESAA